MLELTCPIVECQVKEFVHPISPDFALFTLMIHFQVGHPEMDALSLLDDVEFKDE